LGGSQANESASQPPAGVLPQPGITGPEDGLGARRLLWFPLHFGGEAGDGGGQRAEVDVDLVPGPGFPERLDQPPVRTDDEVFTFMAAIPMRRSSAIEARSSRWSLAASRVAIRSRRLVNSRAL